MRDGQFGFFGSTVVACRLKSAIGWVTLLLVAAVVLSLFFFYFFYYLGGYSLAKEI